MYIINKFSFNYYFSTINPALFYTNSNLRVHQQDLDVKGLLTPKFIEKINHLYNRLYETLSTNYDDGERLSVTFHQDTLFGVSEESTLDQVLDDDIMNKFQDLIDGDSKLSITIQKQGNNIINIREFNGFINSIAFYLVMFNSIALIQESNGLYGLIASQRELFTANYISHLGSVELSIIGQQILATFQSEWNKNDENKLVWNYGDCWPVYLFSDARELLRWFNAHFNGEIQELS